MFGIAYRLASEKLHNISRITADSEDRLAHPLHGRNSVVALKIGLGLETTF